MSVYKVVGRYKEKEQQQSWCRGRPLTQAKKTVYTTTADFLRYSPELIKRWETFCLFTTEIYIQNKHGAWNLLPPPPE